MTSRPTGLGMKLPVMRGIRSFWKRFCIETCYGFWNPDHLKEDLQDTLNNRIKERTPHFEEIKRILHEEDAKIRVCFLDLCSRLKKTPENPLILIQLEIFHGECG